jgi:hypothetical protein
MARKMEYGDWAHVIGTFDLAAKRGTILSMQPAKVALTSTVGGEEHARLKGFDAAGKVLFDLAVHPMRNSCAVQSNERMFEEYVPVQDALTTLKLFVAGVPASEYAPGRPSPPKSIKMGAAAPQSLHRIPLESETPPEKNVTYTVQVRPQGDERWHTMGVNLPTPAVGEIDINQFPGAAALDIRVLQSDGITKKEVFRDRREF